MYNSGISTADLIKSVKSEIDIEIPISDESWYRWINAVEQFVYTEILSLFVSTVVYSDQFEGKTLEIYKHFPSKNGWSEPSYDDIVKVYADDTELERTSVVSGIVFDDKPMYYTDYAGNIKLCIPFEATQITVIYKIRPVLKVKDDSSKINLPVEYVDMLAARLRSEAYKIANDDGQAAKWAAEYNAQLENFKIWAEARGVRYGE